MSGGLFTHLSFGQVLPIGVSSPMMKEEWEEQGRVPKVFRKLEDRVFVLRKLRREIFPGFVNCDLVKVTINERL